MFWGGGVFSSPLPAPATLSCSHALKRTAWHHPSGFPGQEKQQALLLELRTTAHGAPHRRAHSSQLGSTAVSGHGCANASPTGSAMFPSGHVTPSTWANCIPLLLSLMPSRAYTTCVPAPGTLEGAGGALRSWPFVPGGFPTRAIWSRRGWLGWEAAGAPLLGGMVPLLDVSCCIKNNTVVLAGFHRS